MSFILVIHCWGNKLLHINDSLLGFGGNFQQLLAVASYISICNCNSNPNPNFNSNPANMRNGESPFWTVTMVVMTFIAAMFLISQGMARTTHTVKVIQGVDVGSCL